MIRIDRKTSEVIFFMIIKEDSSVNSFGERLELYSKNFLLSRH